MKKCSVCGAVLIQQPTESPANFRRRPTCPTKDCRKKHRKKMVDKINDGRKYHREPKKLRRRFVGKVTSAMDEFLRGGKNANTPR